MTHFGIFERQYMFFPNSVFSPIEVFKAFVIKSPTKPTLTNLEQGTFLLYLKICMLSQFTENDSFQVFNNPDFTVPFYCLKTNLSMYLNIVLLMCICK